MVLFSPAAELIRTLSEAATARLLSIMDSCGLIFSSAFDPLFDFLAVAIAVLPKIFSCTACFGLLLDWGRRVISSRSLAGD